MNDQPNPYDAVIADLKTKIEQMQQLVQQLETLKGGITVLNPFYPSGPPSPNPLYGGVGEIPAGAFLGMGIEDGVKALLRLRKRAMSAQEIAADLLAGGLHLKSETPANTIASVLSRAFKAGSEIVRISRGQWGLQEWYPTRRFDRRGED